jgi:hypothetical protein
MPGLDPGIHHLRKKMDCRVKPGNDDGEISSHRRLRAAFFMEKANGSDA